MHSDDLLIEALNKSEGSYILVSHDRYFVHKTANKIWEIEGYGIKEYTGSYDEWVLILVGHFVYYPECSVKNSSITQQFYWVEDLLHKKHTVHYLQCQETISNQTTGKSSTTNFVRITNLSVDKSTVKNLSKAGRLRWKIENEGFNEEKNNGYNMEHLYSRTSFNAQQNYYQCMLIAHMLNQLLEYTRKIQDPLKRFKKITIKYLWQQLLCAMKCQVLCMQTLTAIDNKKQQIRLFSG